MEYSESDQVITVLNGAVSTRVIHHPSRAFAFLVTLDLIKGSSFFAKKPPMHFHANQDEYIQAVEGRIGLDVEGKEFVLTPGDSEFCIDAWANHRSYPVDLTQQEEGCTIVKFLLSGQKTEEAFQLDTLFFENWYGYQDEVVQSGGKVDLIQVLSTFDAGGTYVSFPSWLPFGKRISQVLGIVAGRWIGRLLGYKPYYEKYSTAVVHR